MQKSNQTFIQAYRDKIELITEHNIPVNESAQNPRRKPINKLLTPKYVQTLMKKTFNDDRLLQIRNKANNVQHPNNKKKGKKWKSRELITPANTNVNESPHDPRGLASDQDKESLKHMEIQHQLGRIVFMHTNMRGQCNKNTNEFVKLKTLIDLVTSGIVQFLCISETKITSNHIHQLKDLMTSRGLSMRLSHYDTKASRGTMIVYQPSEIPFTVGRCRVEINKRAVGMTLYGGNGIKLTLSCSYFEDIQNPIQEQQDFYKFLSNDIPDKEDNKHLYIDMGDKNCVIDKSTQRYPPSTKREQNQTLMGFIKKHNLVEIITTDHRDPNSNIYTRSNEKGDNKSKIDHILLNEAATNIRAESGWTERNPYIHSDHGIVWVSLHTKQLQLLSQKHTKNRNTDALGNGIRLKGAEKTTHEKYNGIPLRICHRDNSMNSKITKLQITKLIEHNGYTNEHFTYHSKIEQRTKETLREHDKEMGTKRATGLIIADSIKFRNTPKEWWLHVKNEQTTRHIMSRGKPMPVPQPGTELHTHLTHPTGKDKTIANQMTDDLEWHISVQNKHITKQALRTHLIDTCNIPKKKQNTSNLLNST